MIGPLAPEGKIFNSFYLTGHGDVLKMKRRSFVNANTCML